MMKNGKTNLAPKECEGGCKQLDIYVLYLSWTSNNSIQWSSVFSGGGDSFTCTVDVTLDNDLLVTEVS